MVDGDIQSVAVLSHPFHVFIDIGCIDHDKKLVLSHLVNQHIVYRSAVGIEHHAIEHLSDGGSCHIIGKDVIDVFLCIGPCDIDFAHMRNIEYAAIASHGVVLFGDRSVLNGHLKAPEGLHQRPERGVLVIQARFFILHILKD